MAADWVGNVLDFWFAELTAEDWFTRKDTTDEAIRQRFGALWEEFQAAVPAAAFRDPDAALAATIALDQFPRNMFRGTAKAFSSDALALAVAGHALHQGFEKGLKEERLPFLFMPFMHSEALADQERCVALFGGPDDEKAKYAVEHRDIIARFGRFPHRNRALGRENTEEERAFLGNHEGFGQ